VTIVSGLLGYNFGLFVALSVVTRGARFFLLAARSIVSATRCEWRSSVILPLFSGFSPL
jgi:membrane protein YqaA with SNARE-associated domain